MQKSPEKQDIMGDPFMYNKQLFITCLKPKQTNNQNPPRQVQLPQRHFPLPVSFTCLWQIGRPWEGIAKPSIWKLGIKQLKCSHETHISSLLTRELLIFCKPFKFLLQDVLYKHEIATLCQNKAISKANEMIETSLLSLIRILPSFPETSPITSLHPPLFLPLKSSKDVVIIGSVSPGRYLNKHRCSYAQTPPRHQTSESEK